MGVGPGDDVEGPDTPIAPDTPQTPFAEARDAGSTSPLPDGVVTPVRGAEVVMDDEDLGEELVLDYEKKRLIDAGNKNFADAIEHVSKTQGDGTGYDIKSFNKDSSVRYIEVKTTSGNINTEFFISPNEIHFSKIHFQNFYLYRVYNVKKNPEFYKFEGNILDNFEAIPTEYKLKVK